MRSRRHREVLTAKVISSELPILGKCSGTEVEYFNKFTKFSFSPVVGTDVIDLWSEAYHSTVDSVVNRHLNPGSSSVECLGESVHELRPPSGAMLELASQLPPWQKRGTGDLSRHDIAAVLLEFLRTYECALAERNYFLYSSVKRELDAGLPDDDVLLYRDVFTEAQEQREKIVHEVTVSRPALYRTLSWTAGVGNNILEAEVECLQRASLDIRNSLAIGAEAAACLPRVWDAKDTLRDISPRNP